jgi:hypothetical protein
MKYIVVKKNGEVIASIPYKGGGISEQLSVYKEMTKQYPEDNILVSLSNAEPFMGW